MTTTTDTNNLTTAIEPVWNLCQITEPQPGDITGQTAIPCDIPTDFNCKYCGPICPSHRALYACSGPDGEHVRG